MTLIAQTGDTMMSLPSSRHARITLAQRTSGSGSEAVMASTRVAPSTATVGEVASYLRL
jgi:hypothetical protein